MRTPSDRYGPSSSLLIFGCFNLFLGFGPSGWHGKSQRWSRVCSFRAFSFGRSRRVSTVKHTGMKRFNIAGLSTGWSVLTDTWQLSISELTGSGRFSKFPGSGLKKLELWVLLFS